MTGMTLFGAINLIGCLVLGLGVGAVYFAAMWKSAQIFAVGGRAFSAIALVAFRFALIVFVLALIATHGGALSLLATALGIMIARSIAMKRVRAMVP